MTDEAKIFLKALYEDRKRKADVMDTESMRRVWSSIVDKYSDQAHFIYELLQNADDAGATRARFVLLANELLFAHNGTRHFSISDPLSERSDSKRGMLGDVNAITSVGNSNKKYNTIGKFGIGFKAVFQYTNTPHIYDPNLNFKIERYIVPVLLDHDHKMRLADETLFVFPFDSETIGAKQAEREIAEKLAALIQPTLFLKHLMRVDYWHGTTRGYYSKKIKTSSSVNDIKVELLNMWQMNFGIDRKEVPSQDFWMFTRTENFNGVKTDISVGFLIDQDKLRPTKYNAFCFFPTKEKTGLNFIIHAPFLLTASRENILAKQYQNIAMIRKLAKLAADALVVFKDVKLIDDGILDIIPCDPSRFTSPDNLDQISFLPFCDEIKSRLKSEAILPTAQPKEYVSSENAYWARTGSLNKLFGNEQLRLLTGNPKATWVFTSVTEKHVGGSELNKFIREIVKVGFEDENLLPLLRAEFIEQQKLYWLKRLYEYLTATALRMKLTRTLPIFLDQDRKASPAFYEDGREVLFLPSKMLSGYQTVYKESLKDDEIKACLEKFGIKEPSLKDEIYNKILPKYDCNDEFDTREDVDKFFMYWRHDALPDDKAEFVERLKTVRCIYCAERRYLPSEMHLHSDELEAYFAGVRAVNFIRASGDMREFFIEIGVNADVPQLIERKLSRNEAIAFKLPRAKSDREVEWRETRIDGCREVLALIEATSDSARSLTLWNVLLNVFDHHFSKRRTPEKILVGTAQYVDAARSRNKEFPSTDIAELRQSKWLFDREGNCRKPADLDRMSLAAEYERDDRLLKFLQIPEAQNLTAEQKRKIDLANRLEEAGITERDIDDLIRARRRSKAEPKSEAQSDQPKAEPKSESRSAQSSRAEQDQSPKPPREKTSADLDKKLADLEQKYEAEREALIQKQELVARAEAAPKYSFEWFTTLLALESRDHDKSGSLEISISFGKIERDPNSDRKVILSQPSRSIPQFIEELTDVKLELSSGGSTLETKPIIEAISVKSFTLHVKLKSPLGTLDLSSVDKASINSRSPIFLLDELGKAFNSLPLAPTFDMKANLPKNIEFIFGPPGTGKTTYLARKILIPEMQKDTPARILVLTPTNKAADVLTRRIITTLEDALSQSYKKWLIRFGATNDDLLEKRGVFCDNSIDISNFKRMVLITTIARFPYDYVHAKGAQLPLKSIRWDYIVIDEASMIPLVNIMLPLYKSSPFRFYIAGDPFQIEPIANVDQWKGENIYSMIGLKSFKQPATEPHNYRVTLLTRQYRSVPEVGEIFSRFAYDGVLIHHRDSSERRPIDISLPIKPLNIIKFPVRKYESVYRAKRLDGGSPYHIYSALFTFEFVRCLAQEIAEHHIGEKFSIGIITPYRAEGELINNLLSSSELPPNISTQVGTVHGFQGDECDIILAVLNPPPSIKKSTSETHLHNLNILNVAISRARDYLFVVMPDDQTADIDLLRHVKRIEKLLKSTGDCNEISCGELEELMFGSNKFIETNAFSTAHQNVNIYGAASQRYEIRSEDAAVDIQLHEGV